MIRRKKPNGALHFDKNLRGWHAYGVEACCQATIDGCGNHVISLPTWHDSKSTNLEKLQEAHEYVWHKHGQALQRIYTTCGVLPDNYNWEDNKQNENLKKLVTWTREKFLRACGFPTRYAHHLEEWLENITNGEPVVEVLHAKSSQTPIEVKSFVPQPQTTRRVLHHFCALDCGIVQAGCVVVAPDLAGKLSGDTGELDRLLHRVRYTVVCVNFQDLYRNHKLWQKLKRLSLRAFAIQRLNRVANFNTDSTAVVVFELHNNV